MGTYVTPVNQHLRFKPEGQKAFCKAMRDLFDKDGQAKSVFHGHAGEYRGGKCIYRCYSWVDGPSSVDYTNAEQIMRDWGWSVYREDPTWILEIDERKWKWSEEELFLRALLPHMEEGSQITFQLEGDGMTVYQYAFEEGKLIHRQGYLKPTWTEEKVA